MHKDSIKDKLLIRPATIEDRRQVFDWLTNSNLTQEMLGPPKFPDNPAPTWEEFVDDYVDYYFDGCQPLKGRSFIIEFDKQAIGQINYNTIDLSEKSTELDIWLSDKKYTGQGLGTKAIELLCHDLEQHFDCEKIYLAPSKRNVAAIKSYKKAGFDQTDDFPINFQPDYEDTVLMIRTKNKI